MCLTSPDVGAQHVLLELRLLGGLGGHLGLVTARDARDLRQLGQVAARDACTYIFYMLGNIFLLLEQIIFGILSCTQEIFGYCFILNLPKLARLAGERLHPVNGWMLAGTV